jgi:hypothetical protein
MNATSRSSPEHPSPGRHAVSQPMLWFGLLAAPLAWSLEELLSYGIASYVCRMKASGVEQTLTHGETPWFWVVLVSTLIIALAGSWVALANWRKTRGEKGGAGQHLLELGEGRSRFIAMASVLTSGGFLLAFVFMFLNLALAPLCGK